MAGPARRSKTSLSPNGAPTLTPLGEYAGRPNLVLSRTVTVVGARKDTRIQLVSSTVSKIHALIINHNGGAYIKDLASRTHVLVNGEEVTETDLAEGDALQIGKFRFTFHAGLPPVRESDARNAPPVKYPPPPDAVLRVDGDELPVPLANRATLIGRRKGADIQLLEASASAAHAVIFVFNGKHVIRDLGSRTGTFVNDEKVQQATLEIGDALRIGDTILTYAAAVADEPAPAPVGELDDLDAAFGVSIAEPSADEADDEIAAPVPAEEFSEPSDALSAIDQELSIRGFETETGLEGLEDDEVEIEAENASPHDTHQLPAQSEDGAVKPVMRLKREAQTDEKSSVSRSSIDVEDEKMQSRGGWRALPADETVLTESPIPFGGPPATDTDAADDTAAPSVNAAPDDSLADAPASADDSVAAQDMSADETPQDDISDATVSETIPTDDEAEPEPEIEPVSDVATVEPMPEPIAEAEPLPVAPLEEDQASIPLADEPSADIDAIDEIEQSATTEAEQTAAESLPTPAADAVDLNDEAVAENPDVALEMIEPQDETANDDVVAEVDIDEPADAIALDAPSSKDVDIEPDVEVAEDEKVMTPEPAVELPLEAHEGELLDDHHDEPAHEIDIFEAEELPLAEPVAPVSQGMGRESILESPPPLQLDDDPDEIDIPAAPTAPAEPLELAAQVPDPTEDALDAIDDLDDAEQGLPPVALDAPPAAVPLDPEPAPEVPLADADDVPAVDMADDDASHDEIAVAPEIDADDDETALTIDDDASDAEAAEILADTDPTPDSALDIESIEPADLDRAESETEEPLSLTADEPTDLSDTALGRDLEAFTGPSTGPLVEPESNREMVDDAALAEVMADDDAAPPLAPDDAAETTPEPAPAASHDDADRDPALLDPVKAEAPPIQPTQPMPAVIPPWGANQDHFLGGQPLSLQRPASAPPPAPRPKLAAKISFDPDSGPIAPPANQPPARRPVRPIGFEGLSLAMDDDIVTTPAALRSVPINDTPAPRDAGGSSVGVWTDAATPSDTISRAPQPDSETPDDTVPPLALPAEPVETTSRGRRRGLDVRMLVILMVLCAVAAAIAVFLLVPASGRLRGVLGFERRNALTRAQQMALLEEQRDLLHSEGVRVSARTSLGDLSPGFLDDDTVYKRMIEENVGWADEADGGLVISRAGTLDSGDEQRLEALLMALYEANAERTNLAASLAAQVDAARAAHTQAQQRLDDLNRRITEEKAISDRRPAPNELAEQQQRVAVLETRAQDAAATARRLQAELDLLRGQMPSDILPAGLGLIPVDDPRLVELEQDLIALNKQIDAARQAQIDAQETPRQRLDAALSDFAAAVTEARQSVPADSPLAAYLQSAQSLHENLRQQIDQMLARAQDQRTKLDTLLAARDEQIAAHQNQQWDKDPDLKQWADQLEMTTRQYNAATSGGLADEAAELKATMELLTHMIDARRLLISDDAYFANALADQQKQIDAQQQAMQNDREQAETTLDEMQSAFLAAQPPADQLSAEQAALVTALGEKLASIDAARHAVAHPSETPAPIAPAVDLAQLEAQKKDLETQIAQRKTDLSNEAEMAAEAQQQQDQLAQIKKVENALADATVAVAAADDALNGANRQLRNLQAALAEAREAEEALGVLAQQRDQAKALVAETLTALESSTAQLDKTVTPRRPKSGENVTVVERTDRAGLYALCSVGAIVGLFTMLILWTAGTSPSLASPSALSRPFPTPKPRPVPGLTEDEEPAPIDTDDSSRTDVQDDAPVTR